MARQRQRLPIGYKTGDVELIKYVEDGTYENSDGRVRKYPMVEAKCHLCGKTFITAEAQLKGSKNKKAITKCAKCAHHQIKEHRYPIGYKQGYIEVVGYAENRGVFKMYKCKCNYCGNEFITSQQLLSGQNGKKPIQSCINCRQGQLDAQLVSKTPRKSNKLGLRNIHEYKKGYLIQKQYKGLRIRLHTNDLQHAIQLRDDLLQEFKQFKNFYEHMKTEGVSEEKLEKFVCESEIAIKHRFGIEGY